MTNLMIIQPFIQDYTLAISSILDAEVTVVDINLIRVAGTGEYKEKIGVRIGHDSFFKSIIKTGKPGMIKNVKKEDWCIGCDKFDTCKELANLGYPIFLNNTVIGVIGIVAFTEEQRENLLNRGNTLEEFLKYMSLLLTSKIETTLSNKELKGQIIDVISSQKADIGNGFIGNTKEIKDILAVVDKIATSTSSVLVTGESGTGKEVLAKHIHSLSDRSNKLMISVNCGAIPENLVESELFGYEEGAFTGAKKGGHMGKFELANNSTIFLDEIGDMPLQVQTKLLRVLQEYKVERVGGKFSIPIDVRVIAATNKNLEDMVKQGTFRQDLYYRLNVIPIKLPPLRERKQDVEVFTEHFINYYNQRLKKNISTVSDEVKKVFSEYNWPGNVRELKNVIEYLENIAEGDIIEISHLPNQLYARVQSTDTKRTLENIVSDYEKIVLTEMMKNVSTLEEKDALAEKLGISRATLYRKLSAYGLCGK